MWHVLSIGNIGTSVCMAVMYAPKLNQVGAVVVG